MMRNLPWFRVKTLTWHFRACTHNTHGHKTHTRIGMIHIACFTCVHTNTVLKAKKRSTKSKHAHNARKQVDFSKRPFFVKSSDREYLAETVIISTGAVAKRMDFPGSGEENGFWYV